MWTVQKVAQTRRLQMDEKMIMVTWEWKMEKLKMAEILIFFIQYFLLQLQLHTI